MVVEDRLPPATISTLPHLYHVTCLVILSRCGKSKSLFMSHELHHLPLQASYHQAPRRPLLHHSFFAPSALPPSSLVAHSQMSLLPQPEDSQNEANPASPRLSTKSGVRVSYPIEWILKTWGRFDSCGSSRGWIDGWTMWNGWDLVVGA